MEDVLAWAVVIVVCGIAALLVIPIVLDLMILVLAILVRGTLLLCILPYLLTTWMWSKLKESRS